MSHIMVPSGLGTRLAITGWVMRILIAQVRKQDSVADGKMRTKLEGHRCHTGSYSA